MRNTVKLNFFGCGFSNFLFQLFCCLACVSMSPFIWVMPAPLPPPLYRGDIYIFFFIFGLSLHGKKSDVVQKKKNKTQTVAT